VAQGEGPEFEPQFCKKEEGGGYHYIKGRVYFVKDYWK
jgi:hypothetical protein